MAERVCNNLACECHCKLHVLNEQISARESLIEMQSLLIHKLREKLAYCEVVEQLKLKSNEIWKETAVAILKHVNEVLLEHVKQLIDKIDCNNKMAEEKLQQIDAEIAEVTRLKKDGYPVNRIAEVERLQRIKRAGAEIDDACVRNEVLEEQLVAVRTVVAERIMTEYEAHIAKLSKDVAEHDETSVDTNKRKATYMATKKKTRH